jgi:membrane-associated phospholipid phosphatase
MTRKWHPSWLLAIVLALEILPASAWAAEDLVPLTLPDAPSEMVTAIPPGYGLGSPLLALLPADTQQAPAKNWFVRGLWRGLHDQCEIYKAPFHRSALKWDIPFVLISGGLIAADRHISGDLSRDDLDVSRRISDVGLYSSTAAVGGLLLTSLATKNKHAREAGTLGLEALANTAAVYSVIQVTAGRERPLEGDGKGYFWQNNSLNSSFPSGHAAFTWTAASVIAHEYPKPWVEWLAYGGASAVSITRVTGLKHFPADVVVGSTFGYLIGRHIFHAHCTRDLSSACGQRK